MSNTYELIQKSYDLLRTKYGIDQAEVDVKWDDIDGCAIYPTDIPSFQTNYCFGRKWESVIEDMERTVDSSLAFKGDEESTVVENILEEGVDVRYVQIVVKNLKSELDAIESFFVGGKTDLVKEYIASTIKALTDLSKRV